MCLICHTVAKLGSTMPRRITKPNQVRVYFADEDVETLKGMSGGVLSLASTASVVLHGALEAIRNNGGVVNFPPRFAVRNYPSGSPGLNEMVGFSLTGTSHIDGIGTFTLDLKTTKAHNAGSFDLEESLTALKAPLVAKGYTETQ